MSTALQEHCKTAEEVRNVSVDFTDSLDFGEVLNGTPTVVSTPTGPTIASIAINTSAIIVNGREVSIGAAVQFTVSGGTADTAYELLVETTTDGSQTIQGLLTLNVT